MHKRAQKARSKGSRTGPLVGGRDSGRNIGKALGAGDPDRPGVATAAPQAVLMLVLFRRRDGRGRRPIGGSTAW